MKTIEELVLAAQAYVSSAAPARIALAAAHDGEVLEAVEAARKAGIADALLIGDRAVLEQIAVSKNIDLDAYTLIDEGSLANAAAIAVEKVRQGEASFVMKGLLDTSILLRAVLNKEKGLQCGGLISHVGVMEAPGYHKLLFVSDAAITIAPNLQEKLEIIRNAVRCAHALGIEIPKVALLAALEKVNPEKMPCTADAAILTQMNRRGQLTSCIVDGPLALDNAVSAESVRIKKIESPVAGDADILIAPDIEAGNILYKSIIDLGGGKGAGLVMGAAAPVVLTSRADSAETKLASIALAVLVSAGNC